MEFRAFNLDDSLMEGIESMGYTTATPVQEKVIPAILAGNDLIAAAQTGTGKTAAFLIPVLQRLLTMPHDNHKTSTLIIVPTRELAQQISQNIEGLTYYTPISAIAIYGGGSGNLFAAERKALVSGADIIVCTPGRIIAHLNMGYVNWDGIKYFILDEADRMLDMGFFEDIQKIISHLPQQRQNLLFSATMPPAMRKLANSILKQPVEINIALSKAPELITQGVFFVYDHQKVALATHLLSLGQYGCILIFCSSKIQVKNLYIALKNANMPVSYISSDLEQAEREQILQNFKSKRTKILVATDLLSRGIDIDDIELVINYDIPHDAEDYIHRIGRTARAATKGTAYTFVGESEQYKFNKIEQVLQNTVPRIALPEALGAPPPTKNSFEKPKKKKRKKF
ncbi:MAG: DEAD/DEAH box helicase [Chitinophagia bacterium]|nr:DEAD/DEAH box helicase [Chitinophagia bacterium]